MIDAEFKLVRPPRQFSWPRLIWFWIFATLLIGAATQFAGTQEDKIALGAIVAWAAFISPTLRWLSSLGQKVSGEEAEWLAERRRHPERSAMRRLP